MSLRYFRLGADGKPAYVTNADIDAAAHKPHELHALFDDMELRFRAAGDATAPVRVARHISYNLDDEHLKADPALLAYLTAQCENGKVAAMTKAATHLLWNPHFSTIRGWLVDHVDWMVSEFGTPNERDAADLKRLFASEPKRDLAFRYGYPDSAGHAHMIVTRRALDGGN